MKTQLESSRILNKALCLLEENGWSNQHQLQFHRDESETFSLLSAIQQAANYDLDVYKVVVLDLSSRVKPIYGFATTWPIAALELAAWECEPCRCFEDIKQLLSQF